ncbi:hypothetical protein Golax_017296 [Gossypium laxum]|uniref:Uncharacterized protein n=1 Tax=Gossypium laxum TaxID=34288 RepID=A0A7J8YZU0_9ROSI|nr:hypothetical protein [Gossypium laxum]
MVQIRGMHTLIRDRDISKHDFVFYSDRLIRLQRYILGLIFAKSCAAFPLSEAYI